MTISHRSRHAAHQLRNMLMLVGVLAVAQIAQAKPLYITVNRAFTPSEEAQVDVAFSQKSPVELRVLKPKDVDAYVDGQANLRRAWDRPPALINPGRYLSQGLNAVKLPGQYLLLAMKPEMRTALGVELAGERQETVTSKIVLDEGDKKLLGVPDGMQVVRRQWLNLDLGGAQRAFDVPGFEGWSSTSSGFEERRVSLKPLPAGVYVLQLVQGQVEGQVVLVVTDLNVAVKQTDGRALVRVADSAQAPVKDARVTIRRTGAPPLERRTDDKGEAWFDVNEPRLLVLARRDVQNSNTNGNGKTTDTAIVDTDFYSTLAASPDVFIYTDRPIYRPGDEIQFRGIARLPDGFLARLFSPKNREVNVQVAAVQGGGPVLSHRVQLDEFGSFSGRVVVPESAEEGVFRATATLDGHGHQSEVRVQQYVKPTFFIDVTTASETVVPGQSLTADLRVERYAGGVPAGTRYEVLLTRTTVDAPAWVDDAGMGGKGSAVTYGSVSTSEGKLSVPERVYSSVHARIDDGSIAFDDTWASAPAFDAEGKAHIEIPIPALKPGEERLPFKYTLNIRARDDQETFASKNVPLFLSPVEVMGLLRTSTSIARLGGSIELAVRSTSLSGKPMGNIAGQVVWRHKTPGGREDTTSPQALRTGDDGVARIAVPTARSGVVTAEVTLTDQKGGVWTGDTRVLVASDDGSPVEWVPELSLMAETDVLEPGSQGRIIALFPDEWGTAGRAEGTVWVTLSGSTLFMTETLAFKGNTLTIPFDVEKRFGSAVYVSVAYATRSGRFEERTAPFRIIPRERVLTVALEPERREVEPMTEQQVRIRVTDHLGRGVPAQLSLGVVDEAIYAVQPEFRPSILEFFYPMVRNNVATFASAEFQGYGYGHYLASLAHAGAVRFAAIKPPKKKADDRDTAYFNANIRTDEDGTATVAFRMPSNATLWTMTAVVADAKGRVGETTGRFASRGDGALHIAAPAFLREGDTTTARVRLSRGNKDAGSEVTLVPNIDNAAVVKSNTATATATVDVRAKNEASTSLAMTAVTPGRAQLSVATQGGVKRISDARELRVLSSMVSDAVEISRVGKGPLRLVLGAGARTRDVELVIQPSLVDAALQDVRTLLVYPHGCLEQLVATTVPTLALIEVLEQEGGFSQLDAETQALLLEAKSAADQGVARILDHAVKGGGFGWFGSDEASPAMTLLALKGLVVAADVGAVDKHDPRIVAALRYLGSQPLSETLAIFRTYVSARLLGKEAAPAVRAAMSSSRDPLSAALLVLSAEAAGISKEPTLQTALQALANDAKAAFLSGQVNLAAVDAWQLPLGPIGAVAITGDAARLAGGAEPALVTRFMQLFAEEDLSTLDRATLLLHALPLVASEASRAQTQTQTLTSLAGVDAGAPITFSPRGHGIVAKLKDGTTEVTLPAFSGVATLRAHVEQPASTAPAKSDGFAISRRYYSIGAGQKLPLDSKTSVKQGDVVFVELTIELNGDNVGRSAYSVIEDAVPAGFTPLQEDKVYRAAPLELPLTHDRVKFRSFQADRVRFYVEEPAWWMGTPRVLGYVMRADFVGDYLAPGATAIDMYQHKSSARTASQHVVIAPSAATP